MVWCGCSKFSTVVVVSVNVLFMLFAMAVTAIGVFALVQTSLIKDQFEFFADLDLTLYPILIVVVGFLLMCTAMLGCLASIKKNKICLTIYAILLAILAIIQLAGGIALFVLKTTVQDKINSTAETEWFNPLNNDTRKNVEKWLGCCGWNGTTEAEFVEPIPEDGNSTNILNCSDYQAANGGENTPCKDKMVQFVEKAMIPSASAVIAFAVLQLCALAATIYLRIKGGDADDVTELSDF
jgi:hypothetical protein